MTSNWLQLGVIMVKIKYVQWRNGAAYYRRRIPDHLQGHRSTTKKPKTHEFFSLKTKDYAEAAELAQRHTERLDREWGNLRPDAAEHAREMAKARALLHRLNIRLFEAYRLDRCDEALERLHDEFAAEIYVETPSGTQTDYSGLPPYGRIAYELAFSPEDEVAKLVVPSFSECVEKYCYFNPDRESDRQFHRSVDLFIELNGNLPIDQYKRSHANAFVDAILKRGNSAATIKRYCAQVRPVFNTAITELEVKISNPFAKITIPKNAAPEKERLPFSLQQVHAIQDRCFEVGDHHRLLIALLSDTGMRLSEAVGLMTSDIFLDSPVPYIDLRPNKFRTVKNDGSARKIPLVGAALDSSKVLLKLNPTGPLFPDFVKVNGTKADSLSSSLKKWLVQQGLCTAEYSLHCFRHSLRDRSRNAGVPSDACDRIGGWASKGVGESYGQGHQLQVLFNYMTQMIDYERSFRN